MKYSFTINQKAIIESGLKLDINDASIMSFLNTFALSPKIEKKLIGNKIFCWFQYEHIANNLPLLDLQKDAIYRRIKKMVEFKILEPHPDNQTCGKAFFHLTQMFFDMFFNTDIPTAPEPYPYGFKPEPPTAPEPYNKDISNNILNKKRERLNSLKKELLQSQLQLERICMNISIDMAYCKYLVEKYFIDLELSNNVVPDRSECIKYFGNWARKHKRDYQKDYSEARQQKQTGQTGELFNNGTGGAVFG